MELAALGSVSVLRDADVVTSREKARQARLSRLLVVLVVIGVPVIGRTAAGVVRYLQGNYAAAAADFHWPHPGIPSSFLPYLPGLLLIVLLGAVMAGPLLMAGRSPHVLYRPEEVGVTLADVVGAGPVVEEVVKTLNLFLAHRTFEEGMGGTPRRAVLFEGPPGTGKTYIAKAMAAEAGVPFLFVSSSAFQSMYYGQTNRKIRSYFRALRNYARREGGAIGFIEEIDAIGATRGGMGRAGREGIAGVVNELLIQLQSFDVPPFGHAPPMRLSMWPTAGCRPRTLSKSGWPNRPTSLWSGPPTGPPTSTRRYCARAASTRPSGWTSPAAPAGARSSTTTWLGRRMPPSSTIPPNGTPCPGRPSGIRR